MDYDFESPSTGILAPVIERAASDATLESAKPHASPTTARKNKRRIEELQYCSF
jgi:hypothetical protein